MTKEQALELLKSAPSGSKPSRINRSLTVDQSKEIVTKCIQAYPDKHQFFGIIEKRVWQVYFNRKRPPAYRESSDSIQQEQAQPLQVGGDGLSIHHDGM